MSIERQDEVIEEIASQLERWGLTVPGIVFLEANKPFSFLGSQLLLFFQPVLNSLVHPTVSDRYIEFLEDRGAIERLVQKLEAGSRRVPQKDAPCK